MHIDVAEELRLCHAASVTEGMLASDVDRRFNAEAFQRALWRHRESIMRLIQDADDGRRRVAELQRALQPFGRAAGVLVAGENPVLISLPAAGNGRTFVQLRPRDFRFAAALCAP